MNESNAEVYWEILGNVSQNFEGAESKQSHHMGNA